MKRALSIFITLFLSLAIIMPASAAGQQDTGAAKDEKLKIGILMAFTGDLKEYGEAISKGVLLAAKQITEAGFTVETVIEDTETSEIAGTNAARNLVNLSGVTAIVGALGSGVTMAVAQSVAIPNKVITISPSSTSPLITYLPADEGKNYLYRTTPSDALQGVVAGSEVAKMVKTASIMYVNNAYGQGLANEFKKSFEKSGGKVLAMVPHEQGIPTYNAELAKALKDSPEIMACFSYPKSATVYVKEAIEFYSFKNFFFCDGTKSLEMIKALGRENLQGLMGTSAASVEGAAQNLFNEAFEAEYKVLPPLPYITNSYDATALIALAAYKTKIEGNALTSENIKKHITDVSRAPGEVILPGEFAKAFKLIAEGKEINYEGAAGSADFDANGDVITPIEIWKFEGDTIVQEKIVTAK